MLSSHTFPWRFSGLNCLEHVGKCLGCLAFEQLPGQGTNGGCQGMNGGCRVYVVNMISGAS